MEGDGLGRRVIQRLQREVELMKTLMIKRKSDPNTFKDPATKNELTHNCIRLASAIDATILVFKQKKQNTQIQNLPFQSSLNALTKLLILLFQIRRDPELLPAITVLLFSVRNASAYGWFSSGSNSAIATMFQQVSSVFLCIPSIETPKVGLDDIANIARLVYPSFGLGSVLLSLETVSGFQCHVADFQINEGIINRQRIFLLVVRKAISSQSNPSSGFFVSRPPDANFYINGKLIPKNCNEISTMLGFGVNLLQAVGDFDGPYVISALGMTENISNPPPVPAEQLLKQSLSAPISDDMKRSSSVSNSTETKRSFSNSPRSVELKQGISNPNFADLSSSPLRSAELKQGISNPNFADLSSSPLHSAELKQGISNLNSVEPNRSFSNSPSSAALKQGTDTPHSAPPCCEPEQCGMSQAESIEEFSESEMVSVVCPIGGKRIDAPVKGVNCKHNQCFDYKCFMEINLRNPEWRCPCCKNAVTSKDLRLDYSMQKVLQEIGPDTTHVQVYKNGQWRAVATSENRVSQVSQQQNQNSGHGFHQARPLQGSFTNNTRAENQIRQNGIVHSQGGFEGVAQVQKDLGAVRMMPHRGSPSGQELLSDFGEAYRPIARMRGSIPPPSRPL